MIYSVILLAASAALASAQAVTYDPTTGVFTCPASTPNGAYCASNDGKTNIIIRCNNGIGQPGNCNDNLSGTFPLGLSYSPCYQTSETAGDAACSKNCLVYSANGTFPVPGCSPTTTRSVASSTSVLPSSSTSISASTTAVSSSSTSVSASSSPVPTSSASTTITSIVTTTCTTDGTTTTQTFTTTYCPTSTFSTVTVPNPTGGPSSAPSNGTLPSSIGPINNGTSIISFTRAPTATPVGPTSTGIAPPTFSNGAKSNSAGAGIAAIGFALAYLI